MKKNNKQMSQAAKMDALVKKTIVVVIIGAVLLITAMVSNYLIAEQLRNQVEVTKALEEYRAVSKEFTVDAQSYVVTGEEHFYEAYMQETEVDKNREKAVALLEKEITNDELVRFQEIQVIDDGMIPLEMSAFEAMKKGNAIRVFLACNADPAITEPIAALCKQNHVDVAWVRSMTDLGHACGIEVGAAAAAAVD